MRQRSGYLTSQIAQDFEFEARLGQWFLDPEAISQRVMDWTEGQPFLSYRLFELVLRSPQGGPSNRPQTQNPDRQPTGEWLDSFIREQCIDRCTDPELLKHVRNICRSILEDTRSVQLLTLYQRIFQGEQLASEPPTAVQRRLVQTGLIRTHQGTLVLGNRLYGEIFNQQWLNRAFKTVQSKPRASTKRTVSDLMGNGLPSMAIHELPSKVIPTGAPVGKRLNPAQNPARRVKALPSRQLSLLPQSQRSSMAQSTDLQLGDLQPGDSKVLSTPVKEPLAPPARRLGIALLVCTLGAVTVLAMTYVGRWSNPEAVGSDRPIQKGLSQ